MQETCLPQKNNSTVALSLSQEKIFRYLSEYISTNMPDILKIPFDWCLDINTPILL